jgi:hypothetical protein
MPTRPITERYTPPAPRELPELRAAPGGLAGHGPQFYLSMTLIGRHWLPLGSDLAADAARYAGQEHSRVADGDLYWVSEPMTSLARYAAQLPTRNLYPHDVPSRRGFMVFQAPLATCRNGAGREVQIVAVSWRPWHDPLDRPAPGGLHPDLRQPPRATAAPLRARPRNRQHGHGRILEPCPGHGPPLLPRQ